MKSIRPFDYLRRCIDCNRNLPNHRGSSLKRGIWRCVECTQKGKK